MSLLLSPPLYKKMKFFLRVDQGGTAELQPCLGREEVSSGFMVLIFAFPQFLINVILIRWVLCALVYVAAWDERLGAFCSLLRCFDSTDGGCIMHWLKKNTACLYCLVKFLSLRCFHPQTLHSQIKTRLALPPNSAPLSYHSPIKPAISNYMVFI